MDWLNKIQQQAQEAAEKLISSETAERARQLAAEATKQATVLAQQATVKAQEVAKEAIGEAEKSITAFRHKAPQAAAPDAVQYGITPELERFVCSLTYSTFSEYPLDSLDVPSEAQQQRLNSWQETHARLMLQRVQQLQDLRFVLCPKRMDEYMFWLIYFTLCKRYLPHQQQQQHEPHSQQQQQQAEDDEETAAVAAAGAAAAAAAAAAAGAGAGGAAAAAGTHSSSAGALLEPQQAASPSAAAAADGAATEAGAAANAGPASPAAGADATTAAGGGNGEEGSQDDLADLADDPELSAYLQDALQLEGKGGGADAGGSEGELGSDDIQDLDDYLTQLDAEVNAPKE